MGKRHYVEISLNFASNPYPRPCMKYSKLEIIIYERSNSVLTSAALPFPPFFEFNTSVTPDYRSYARFILAFLLHHVENIKRPIYVFFIYVFESLTHSALEVKKMFTFFYWLNSSTNKKLAGGGVEGGGILNGQCFLFRYILFEIDMKFYRNNWI